MYYCYYQNAAHIAALPGVVLTGHTGRRKEMMGTYLVNKKYSPSTFGGNVYTLDGNQDRHVYRSASETWWLGDTGGMRSGASSGFLVTAQSALTPLTSEVAWQSHNGSEWVTDPAMECLEFTEAMRDAAGAARSRILAVKRVAVSGHTDKFKSMMGTYKKNKQKSPMNEGNVYTMEENSDRHLYRANHHWWIGDTSSMSSGADSGYFHSQGNPVSPFDVEAWIFHNGSAWVADPNMTIVAK